ncbi:MAG: C10 family peptidase, partial [Balneolaceae bacterium]
WNSMPNTSGSNTISELMYDAGTVVGMDWGCDASGASEDDIVPALRNTFGYNSATQIGYAGTNNYNDVRDDLNDGLPVIFTGYEKDYVLGFPVKGEGHAWVSDGYRSGTLCPYGDTYLSFHMNWGWTGSYNGFYAFNNFHPGSSDYDYKSKVIINIEP